MHPSHSLTHILGLLAVQVSALPQLHERSTPLGAYIVKGGKLPAAFRAYEDESVWMEQKYAAQGSCPTAGSPSRGALKIAPKKADTFLSSLKSNKNHKRGRTSDESADHMVWINLQVGSKKAQIPVIVDTGSHDIAIPADDCERCSEPTFDYRASKSFQETKDFYRISYLDNCAVRGFAAADTFKYVQTTGDSLKLENQAFFAVTEETRTTSENVDVEPDSDEADPDGFHGLLGLALGPSTSVKNGPGFLDALVANNLIDRPYFSMYFALPDSGGNERSSICFGCIEEDNILHNSVDAFIYHDLPSTEESDWSLESPGFYIGEDQRLSTRPFQAYIDSGASLIHVPADVAQAFYDSIPGSFQYTEKMWAFKCGPEDELPPLYLGFGTHKYELDPVHFNLGALSDGGDECIGAVFEGHLDGVAIVGGPFLRDRVVVFEKDKRRIGFAQAAIRTM